MPKRKRNKRRKAVNLGFVRSLAHELRAEILMILTERMASPNELAQMLDEGLSQVSYHVKVLKDYGRIKLVKTEPRRGAVEHYYRATADTLLPARAWREAKGLRTVIGAGLASDLFDDLADAVDAQKLTEADSHINRILLLLDAEGRENVNAIVKRVAEEIEKEQRASASRVTKAKGEAVVVMPYTVGMLAFEDNREVINGAQPSNGAKAAVAKGKTAKAKGTNASKKKRGAKSGNSHKGKGKTVGN